MEENKDSRENKMITLKTLPQATEQEVFDQVVNHLLTQKKKSSEDGDCFYRGPNNLKCAAGCLISDEEYDSAWEGYGWKYLANNYKLAHTTLIEALQDVHDNKFPSQWKRKLKSLAFAFDLKFNPPSTDSHDPNPPK